MCFRCAQPLSLLFLKKQLTFYLYLPRYVCARISTPSLEARCETHTHTYLQDKSDCECMSHSKKVTLEGKSRLPNRIQDLILDFGSVLANIQNTSGSNETLAASVKSLVAMEPVLNNSMYLLEKIDKMMDRLVSHNSTINQSIIEISEVQEKLQNMEQNSYFSNNKHDTQPIPANHK